MRRLRIRRPASRMLLALCALGWFLQANAYDVQDQRALYIKDKEALARKVLQEHGVKFDARGCPIQDQNFARAADAFRQQDQALRSRYDDNGARDKALEQFLRDAGVDPKTAIEASGSKPGSEDYRGFLGDRYMTIKDKAHLEAILKAAGPRAKVHRNRITIDGFDCNIYFSESVAGVGNWKAALSDHEVVVSPTPTQQAKKVEGHYRGDVPDDTGDQLRMLQEVSKGVHKANKAVKDAGGKPVLSESEASRAAQRKAGNDAETELALLGMPGEERKKFLNDQREDAAAKIRQSVEKYEKARTDQMDKLQQERDWARAQSQQAADAGDADKASQLDRQARDADAKVENLAKEQQVDRLTTKVTEKKNPQFAEKVSPQYGAELTAQTDSRKGPPKLFADGAAQTDSRKEPPKLFADGADYKKAAAKPSGPNVDVGKAPNRSPAVSGVPTPGQARAQKGLSWIGNVMDLYDAYQTEKEDAKASGREFSWGRMGAHTVLNMTGIAGAWSAGQSLKYETTKGTEEYIQQQLKYFQEAGYDTSSFKVRAWIAAKAITRGTILGSYEGAKGLPMIGEVLSAPENVYRLTEATIGLFHDTRRSNAIIADNKVQQAATRQEALAIGRAQLEALQQLDSAIRQQNEVLAKMLKESDQAREALPKIHAQLVDDQALLTAFSQDAAVLQRNIADVQARVRQIAADLNAVRTTADNLAGAVTNTTAQLQARQITPETAKGTLAAAIKRYEALQTGCAELGKRLESLMKLAQPSEAAETIAAARARASAIAEDMKKAAAFTDALERLATVQQDAIQEFDRRQTMLINGLVYFYIRASGGSAEEAEFLRLIRAAEALQTQVRHINQALKSAKALRQGVSVLMRMAQKMPFPPGDAARGMSANEQIAAEFQTLKDPALKADAALANLKGALERLHAAIGVWTAQTQASGNEDPNRYTAIPPPKTPIQPVRKEEPKPQPVQKPAPPTDYAALAGQCNALHNASLQRRFAKYTNMDGGSYRADWRKPWTWNAAKGRFECDLAVWQTGPAKKDDPKTFKPYIMSEFIGSITGPEAQATIRTGKWFGE